MTGWPLALGYTGGSLIQCVEVLARFALTDSAVSSARIWRFDANVEPSPLGINVPLQIESDVDRLAIFRRGLATPNSATILFQFGNVAIALGLDL